jgi:hypothetical protein
MISNNVLVWLLYIAIGAVITLLIRFSTALLDSITGLRRKK